jgi:uncharacterized membrane protein YfcA
VAISSIILVFIFSLLASFVQFVSGFGFGIVIMTILPYVIPYGEATAISGILAASTSIIPAIRLFRVVPWKKLTPILITFLIVSYFAIQYVSKVDSAQLKHILGVMLVVISIYFFFISERIHLKPTMPVQIGMGTISGVLGGLFAMQGPPAVIYFIASATKAKEYIAVTQWYFLVGNIMMTIYRANAGLVTWEVGRYSMIGLPAIFIGVYLGRRVAKKIKIKLLRKIVYAFLAIAGVIAILT